MNIRQLAETVHRVEESYDRIRKGLAGWDARQPARELEEVHAAVKKYQDVIRAPSARKWAASCPATA